jgi:3-hydroxy-9,10-secoandrosta-1,3,5(10)-triene-9,17-dione monooxygenase
MTAMTMTSHAKSESALNFNDQGEAGAIEAAQKLRPLLLKNAQIHHRIGELTEEVVDAITTAGFQRLSSPRRWGGASLSSAALARVSAEIAKGCPSTAWSLSVSNSAAWMGSQMKDSMQSAIFAEGPPMLTSPQNGSGVLIAVDGGYVFTGRWSYGTNCHHAKFALLQGVFDGAQPLMCLVGIDEVTREDTWDVVGMCGSGSDTLVATNVFVPESNACKMSGISSGEDFSYEKEASDYWSVFPLLRAKALGVLVGTVEGQLEAVVNSSNRPVLYTNYQKKADSGAYRAAIGEVATKIRTARTIMDSANGINDAAALAARGLNKDEAHHVRAEVAFAIQLLADSSNTLMDLAGSSGFSESNLAQRYWLDFNVGSRHIIFNPYVSFEAYGDFVLGRELSVMDEVVL